MTPLEDKLRCLAREATAVADSLSDVSTSEQRRHLIGWGVLGVNGWAADVREAATDELLAAARIEKTGRKR